MEEQIFKLLHIYAKKNRLVDSDYVLALVEYFVTSKKISDQVKDVKIVYGKPTDTLGDGYHVASYNHVSKKLEVYMSVIMDYINSIESDLNLTNLEKKFYTNLQITQFILHELEHANQQKIKNEGIGLEAAILKTSDKASTMFEDCLTALRIGKKMDNDKLKEATKLLEIEDAKYGELYDYSPKERLADIKSIEICQRLVEPFKHNLCKIDQLLKYELYKTYLRGYAIDFTGIESPTVKYFNELRYYDFLKKLDLAGEDFNSDYEKVKKYSLESRLRLGLPISQKEYVETYNIYEKSFKGI